MTERIRNPSAMRKAQGEIRSQLGKGKEMVEEEDLPKLKWLKMILMKTLRLHPPAPIVPRETIEDYNISGYKIPRKTRVIVNLKSIGTDPKHWEDPLKSEPERFLDGSVDFKTQNFKWVPFGFGRRGCPGMNFAIPLLELSLANVLYAFDWELPSGMTVDDVDMEEAPGLTMHKRTPLWLGPTPPTQ